MLDPTKTRSAASCRRPATAFSRRPAARAQASVSARTPGVPSPARRRSHACSLFSLCVVYLGQMLQDHCRADAGEVRRGGSRGNQRHGRRQHWHPRRDGDEALSASRALWLGQYVLVGGRKSEGKGVKVYFIDAEPSECAPTLIIERKHEEIYIPLQYYFKYIFSIHPSTFSSPTLLYSNLVDLSSNDVLCKFGLPLFLVLVSSAFIHYLVVVVLLLLLFVLPRFLRLLLLPFGQAHGESILLLLLALR